MMLTRRRHAIAVAVACGIAVAAVPIGAQPTPRRQAGDSLLHVLDTIAGGSFRVEGGLRTLARVVVRDSLMWDWLWTRITANRIFRTEGDSMPPVRFPLPSVDFSRHMLIVVARGDMPSMQYGVRIERVQASGHELLVDVCSWDPGPDVAQFWSVPAPLDIVRVARSALQVRFVDHRTVSWPYDWRRFRFPPCLRGAQRRVRKRNAGRTAPRGSSEEGGGEQERLPRRDDRRSTR